MQNTMYTGKRRFQDLDTGEIIEIDEIVKRVTRQGFMITYLCAIVDLIDTLGNKKMQVVKYILNHMDKHNNTLILTTQELARKSKTSYQTTQHTLKILESAKIIARKTGSMMVSSNLIHRGNAQKEAYLLTRFESFETEISSSSSSENSPKKKPGRPRKQASIPPEFLPSPEPTLFDEDEEPEQHPEPQPEPAPKPEAKPEPPTKPPTPETDQDRPCAPHRWEDKKGYQRCRSCGAERKECAHQWKNRNGKHGEFQFCPICKKTRSIPTQI